MKWILLTLASLLCGLTIHLYSYLGFSAKVIVKDQVDREFYLVGLSHVGAFHKMNEVIQQVETWAYSQGLPCAKTFGYYIDPPGTVDEDRLRSEGGCVLSAQQFAQLSKKAQEKFSLRKIESRNFLSLEFNGSPAIGPFKVYPKAEEWMLSHRYIQDGPVLEVYEITGPNKLTTNYYFPIKK